MLPIFLVLIVEPILTARILGIFPTPFYSHQSVFQPIWRELSLRHQVTVITTNPFKNSSLTNLTEIDLSFTYKLVYEDHRMQHVINTESNILILMKHVFFVMNNMTEEQFRHPQVQELIKGEDQFDLVLVEAHVPAWFAFSKKFKCPFIVLTSMPGANNFKRIIGDLNNPVFTHSLNLPFAEKLTFGQRVICVLFEILDEVQNRYFSYPAQEKISREAFQDPDINLYEIAKNVTLFFTNEIPGFTKVTTTLPSIIQLNGLQIKPPQKLPQFLQDFLDGASSGLIYLSLGSNVKSYLLSKAKQEILLKVFEKLPFRVIWKFEDEVSDLPSNVKVIKWAPQQDILRHPNTKLFITQGGIQSIDEAIRFGVPLLGVPFFGDQFFNSMRVKCLRLGTWVDFGGLSEEGLQEAILETVDNSTYLRNLEELSDLLSPPRKSLERALWWIEYVLKHRGAHHLRSPLADIPFYQYYLLDVALFLSILLFITTVISLKLVKITWKLCRNSCFKLKID